MTDRPDPPRPPAEPRAIVAHDLCMGVSMCIQAAPGAFRLNAAGQSEFVGPGWATPQELQAAADSCPMAAIRIVDPDARS